ncbi:unnamed protein product [Rotaria magnacalcarata]|uniref:Uncharacterized protein n=2 Tax=Rotaria magnacalcarata TaxID=392030 RepID=A0A816V4T5_9BILA|nr:unnamed protein product [Rotaria magnacalcarata]CAF1424688.1 unnamed protein product [Rotaria magnacalcarata]CAF2119337.1 unnamed protein product [Rotaria magnacalcarata]CAF4058477.1 unnamed protein product [Rotaria magnacalcarata]CAF5079613.1 unnamed protein product [Rotaria magnacalcarata]
MDEITTLERGLFYLLESKEVQSIETTVFIEANPFAKDLPENIDANAETLLRKVRGRIFPIAVRGKSQAGKSTTLNHIAKITKIPLNKMLPVAESFGSTTTCGIWLMIITFKNQDALLLFDVQGTDHGNDEMTYRLIAFTDHVCTKVVDVFRMPMTGFSNDYIDALYCLAVARDSVKNLLPTSNKVILWTDCKLPKKNPSGSKVCNEPKEYHFEILENATNHRQLQTEKAKEYTERTVFLTTPKFSDDITSQIAKLENNDPLIKENLIPIIKTILSDAQPAKIGSCEIVGTDQYIDYLKRIYTCIRNSNIDLPFCQSELIRSIISSSVREQEQWINEQLDEIKQTYEKDLDWIGKYAKGYIDNTVQQCIDKLENKLECFDKTQWNDAVEKLKHSIQSCIKPLLSNFKVSFTDKFIENKYLEIHNLCTLGYQSDVLKLKLNEKLDEIFKKFKEIPLFHDETDSAEERKVKEDLKKRIDELVSAQVYVENRWSRMEDQFQEKILAPEEYVIEQAVETLFSTINYVLMQKFEKYKIRAN